MLLVTTIWQLYRKSNVEQLLCFQLLRDSRTGSLFALPFPEAAAVEVRHCLDDLLLGVHDEGAVADNGLVDGLAA